MAPASAQTVPVVHTSAANVASVCAALERAGVRPELTQSPETCARAERLVLPGVGSFGAVAQHIERAGLTEILRERIAAGRPTLCVCLGMQLLAPASDEAPGIAGLGVIESTTDGAVRRFDDAPGLRVPQLGWNNVTPDTNCALLAPGEAYFANSYRMTDTPRGWAAAWSDHGGPFVAALERGGVLATQFHPELSGPWGAALIARWLERSAELARNITPIDRAAHVQTEQLETPRSGSGVMPRVIPCLDVRDGRVVKGVRFQGLRDAGDPVERAAAYEAQGADELVILDVSATPEGRAHAAETVDAVRRVLSIPLTVGGGVRAPADARRLLDAGADKVGVNTAAVERPELVGELAQTFGVQCTVVAIDAAVRTDAAAAGGGWEVVTRSGAHRTGIDAIEWCARCEQLGAGEILLTSWDRDGTRTGYDLELLRAVTGRVALPVIASGGVNDPAHLAEGVDAGATGVLAASIFHDKDWTVEGVKRAMAQATGLRLRTTTATTAEKATRS